MPNPRDAQLLMLFHYCRLQLPRINLTGRQFADEIQRMFSVHQKKHEEIEWATFIENLAPIDAFVAVGCLQKDERAWDSLFAARAGRADRLLIDDLRARAVRLFPHNEEKQETAIADFWGHLLVSQSPKSVPVLARYDGQRPLVPWLIRVFQNWRISILRKKDNLADMLVDDDLLDDQSDSHQPDARWHEEFCEAAREWLKGLSENEILLLGLRFRYRMSQREIASLFEVHEGSISRQISPLRDKSLTYLREHLTAQGWTGDDLDGFIHTEMAALLIEEPRLAAENLGRILARQGKSLPEN